MKFSQIWCLTFFILDDYFNSPTVSQYNNFQTPHFLDLLHVRIAEQRNAIESHAYIALKNTFGYIAIFNTFNLHKLFFKKPEVSLISFSTSFITRPLLQGDNQNVNWGKGSELSYIQLYPTNFL